MKRSLLPLAAFALALALALGLTLPRLKPPAEPVFAMTPAAPVQAAPQIQPAATAMLLPSYGATAHSVSLALLPDGRIAAAWFTGRREGARDVAIVLSTYDGKAWSAPRPIVERAAAQSALGRLIRKLGNPVLWSDPQGGLHLWFVSVSYGGWAGSSINHMQSADGGRHWSKIERLITSPFWNLSTLVRNPPLALMNGGIGLPVYHEFIVKRPAWLRLDGNGRIADLSRIPAASKTLQPAAVALDEHRALALMRDSGPLHRIHAAHSDDAGGHWQAALATPLPNPNSALALLRLADGSLLLACNLLESNRHQLALLHSQDEGRRWSLPLLVEQGGSDDEFSYPALLQDAGGTVHLAYTWKRQAIKHVSLPFAQIEALP